MFFLPLEEMSFYAGNYHCRLSPGHSSDWCAGGAEHFWNEGAALTGKSFGPFVFFAALSASFTGGGFSMGNRCVANLSVFSAVQLFLIP